MGIGDPFLSNVIINFILSVYSEQKVKDLILLAVRQQHVGKVLYELPTHHSASAPQIDLQSPLLHPFQLPHAQTYWHVSEEAYTTPRYSSPKGHQQFCHTHCNSEFLLKLPAASFAKAQLLHANSQ